MSRKPGTNVVKVAVLPIVVAVAFLIFMILSLHSGNGTTTSSMPDPIGVGSALNSVGYGVLNNAGYVLEGNMNTSIFPQNLFGNIQGYNGVYALGSATFSERLTVFIFNNTTAPISMDNFNTVSSMLAYESNSTVYNLTGYTYNGVNVKMYKIVTYLHNSTSIINVTEFGSSFSYRNLLAVGSFDTQSMTENITTLMIAQLRSRYG